MSADQINWSESYSNILPEDYVGVQSCVECHQDQHDAWSTHSHATMNQLPTQQSVKGNFDDFTLQLPTGKVTFVTETQDDGTHQYKMRLFQIDPHSLNSHLPTTKTTEPLREYLVTKTVGSRFIQAYVGRQISGPEPADHDIYREHKLPFAYWFKIEQWLPEKYYNIHHQETLENGIPQTDGIDFTPNVLPYTESCMNCHNTFPYAYRIYHEALVGFPDTTVAAAIGSLAKELSTEQNKVQPTVNSFNHLNEKLDPDKALVSLGISCESCHLGGREHAKHQRQIKFLPTSKYLSLKNKNAKGVHESRSHAPTLLGTCTQCHSGHGELYPTGAGKSNSREALDFHGGFCTTQMSCVDCHDPHAGSDSQMGSLDVAKIAANCANCHNEYSSETARIEHAGGIAHANVNCLDCHMPRYTRGVDRLIRTHRICNPVNEKMVASGMPNACNSCHLEKSTQWTLDGLGKMWGHVIEPKQDWKAYRNLDQPLESFGSIVQTVILDWSQHNCMVMPPTRIHWMLKPK